MRVERIGNEAAKLSEHGGAVLLFVRGKQVGGAHLEAV